MPPIRRSARARIQVNPYQAEGRHREDDHQMNQFRRQQQHPPVQNEDINDEERFEQLRQEITTFLTWTRTALRCPHKHFRLEMEKLLKPFMLSICYGAPTELFRLFSSDIPDFNRKVALLQRELPAPIPWNENQIDILEAYSPNWIQWPEAPFIFKIKTSFWEKDGHRTLQLIFAPENQTTSFLNAIANFINSNSTTQLHPEFITGTIRSMLSKTFNSLFGLRIICMKCKEAITEDSTRSHIAKHHQGIFAANYEEFLQEEEEDRAMIRRMKTFLLYPAFRQMLTDDETFENYWRDCSLARISGNDRNNERANFDILLTRDEGAITVEPLEYIPN